MASHKRAGPRCGHGRAETDIRRQCGDANIRLDIGISMTGTGTRINVHCFEHPAFLNLWTLFFPTGAPAMPHHPGRTKCR